MDWLEVAFTFSLLANKEREMGILSYIQENIHLLEALTSIILLLTFILSYMGTMN